MKGEPSLVIGAHVLLYGGLIAFFTWLTLTFRRHQRRLQRGDFLKPLAERLGQAVLTDPAAPMPILRLDLRGLRAYFSHWPFGPTSFRVISMLEVQVGCEGFLEATSLRGRRHPSMTTRITQVSSAS